MIVWCDEDGGNSGNSMIDGDKDEDVKTFILLLLQRKEAEKRKGINDA